MNSYDKFRDDELMEVYTTMMDYSGKADAEVMEAIARRGGVKDLLEKLESGKRIPDEIARIAREVNIYYSQAINADLIKTLISSVILSREDLDKVIDERFAAAGAIMRDRSISGQTVIGCIVGAVVSGIFGGVLWGLTILYLHHIWYAFIIPVYILCYWTIKMITRQSRNNLLVFIASVVGTIIAIIIGLAITYL